MHRANKNKMIKNQYRYNLNLTIIPAIKMFQMMIINKKQETAIVVAKCNILTLINNYRRKIKKNYLNKV